MPDLSRYLTVDRLQAEGDRWSVRTAIAATTAQASKTLIQVGTVLLLARLIVPEAFGAVAMVVAVIALFELLRDFAVSTVVVGRDDVTQSEMSNLFWVTVCLSGAGFAAICAAAPLFGAWFAGVAAEPLAIWLGLGILLSGLSTQHVAILRGRMRFAALSVTELAASAFGACIAIVAAVMDAGIWALVAQRLATSGCVLLFAWLLSGWRPAGPSTDTPIGHLLGFGGNRSIPTIADHAARNLDQILIGWWWGAAGLGFYERTSKVFLAPIRNMSLPLYAVAATTLADLRAAPEKYRRAYLRMLQSACMVTMPLSAVLIAAPDWAVTALFGHRWLDAAPIAMWIGIAAASLPAIRMSGWLLVSHERDGEFARWSAADFLLRLLAVVGGLPFGPEGVVAALALSGGLVRMPSLFWLAGRKGPVSMSDLYGALLPSMLIGGLIVASILLARTLPVFQPLDPLAGFAAAALLALLGTVAGIVALPRCRRMLRDVRILRLKLFRLETGR